MIDNRRNTIMKFDRLMLKQLDEQLKSWNIIKQQPKPRKGWINLIRTALGLSSRQLAKRMAVNQARIMQIESAEPHESITLKTLTKAAEAMGCKVVYSLVPNTTLSDVLKQQARKVAKQRLERVSHSMGLEAQKIPAHKEQEQFEELVKELLENPPKKLWSEE